MNEIDVAKWFDENETDNKKSDFVSVIMKKDPTYNRYMKSLEEPNVKE